MAEAYLGEIRLFATTFVPEGWMACQGQELLISQYNALYSLLGISYGGDASTKFNLPDLRNRVPMQVGPGPIATFNVGTKGGMTPAAVTATGTATMNNVNQLPAHTHAATIHVSNDPGTKAAPMANGYLGTVKAAGIAAAPSLYVETAATTTPLNTATATIGSAGATTPQPIPVSVTGQAAPVLPPCVGMFYAICISGIYPPRPF